MVYSTGRRYSFPSFPHTTARRLPSSCSAGRTITSLFPIFRQRRFRRFCEVPGFTEGQAFARFLPTSPTRPNPTGSEPARQVRRRPRRESPCRTGPPLLPRPPRRPRQRRSCSARSYPTSSYPTSTGQSPVGQRTVAWRSVGRFGLPCLCS
jgi:hypothetical protein